MSITVQKTLDHIQKTFHQMHQGYMVALTCVDIQLEENVTKQWYVGVYIVHINNLLGRNEVKKTITSKKLGDNVIIYELAEYLNELYSGNIPLLVANSLMIILDTDVGGLVDKIINGNVSRPNANINVWLNKKVGKYAQSQEELKFWWANAALMHAGFRSSFQNIEGIYPDIFKRNYFEATLIDIVEDFTEAKRNSTLNTIPPNDYDLYQAIKQIRQQQMELDL